MHAPEDLVAIALTIVVALICGMVMDRLRQPAVVGYILAGIVLGPTALALVQSQDGVRLLAELGVLMLLFLVGMHLSLRAFKTVWKLSLGVSICQTGAGVGIMLLLGWLFDWGVGVSVVLGFIVALSSTAVVIKLLEQLNILRQPVGQITIGVLIAQDLAVVPMLLTIETLGSDAFDPFQIVKIVVAVLFLFAFIYGLSRRRRLVLAFSRRIKDHPDLVPLAGLVYCFGGATLTGLLGLSPVLGAFLAGLVVGNSTGRSVMIRETRPVQAVLMMVFFLSIGLLIDLNFIWQNIGTVLLLLFLVSVVKTGLNIGFLRLLGQPWPHAIIAGVILAQIGEFSLVISTSATNLGILDNDMGQLIIAVTALSLLITPLWLSMSRRIMRAIIMSVSSWRGVLQAVSGTPAIAWSILVGEVTVKTTRKAAGGTGRQLSRWGKKAVALFRDQRTARKTKTDQKKEADSGKDTGGEAAGSLEEKG